MSKPSRGDIPFHPIGHDVNPGNLGISIREYFAAMSMQGLLSAVYSDMTMLNDFTQGGDGGFRRHVSGAEAFGVNAVAYADALIRALKDSEAT